MSRAAKSGELFSRTDNGGYQLDVRGYGCPHVQIYTEKALEKLTGGEALTVVFDNPSSSESIFYFCRARGHEILQRDEHSGTFTWRIRKT